MIAAGVDPAAISIDPDYADRSGYDPGFLGAGARGIALPTLGPALEVKAATNSMASTGHKHVLPYHHFSVVLSKERKLAFFTAVNIDGKASFPIRRATDRWSFDPRVPKDEQTGDLVYEHNKLDRGHLVRRIDPAWGSSEAEAKTANDDTFHYTNCTPQHKDFNENRTTWAGLENYLLNHATNLGFRATVFSGPVLADDDDLYEGVQLPRQFWKVAAMIKNDDQLSATAYLLSQESLIKNLAVTEKFAYGAYKTFQVTLAHIETLTALSFGSLSENDPLANEEAIGLRELTTLDEINL